MPAELWSDNSSNSNSGRGSLNSVKERNGRNVVTPTQQLFGRKKSVINNAVELTFVDKKDTKGLKGVKRLLKAVLLLTIIDFKGYDFDWHEDEKRYREAEEWLFDNDNDTYLFSFISVCEHLDLNPNNVRNTIEAMNEHTLEKIKHAAY